MMFSLIVKAHNGVYYTVDRLTDNNTITGEGINTSGDLRYCLTQANLLNDFVFFSYGLTGTIYLHAALPTITNTNISIYGTGANVTINGNNLYQIFTIADGGVASFTDLILVNGYQFTNSNDGGGSILNYGDIIIDNCIFHGNSSIYNGGALVNKIGAKTQLYNCTFTNNATNGFGGALHNDQGLLIINGCLFKNNNSTMGGGSIKDDGTINLINSTFIENISDGNGTAYMNGSDTTTDYIANCTFFANGSDTVNNKSTIANYGSLVLVNNTIYSNKSSGIYNKDSATLTLINSIVADNGSTNYNVWGTFTGLSQNNILSTSNNSNIFNGQNGNIVNNTVTSILFISSVPGLYSSDILTFALTTISPAMNAGIISVDGIVIPVYDQRGFTRTDMPDVGSYEFIKLYQSILFNPIGAQKYGDPSFSLIATANSGLPVSFSATGPAVISGNTITITGAGTLTITALQQGTNLYNPAFYKQIINVSKGGQTIAGITSLPNITFNKTMLPSTLSGTATSGLPVVYSITGPAYMLGNILTITSAGTITITAFQNGNENYLPANPAITVFTVYKSSQTITGFNPLPDITFTKSMLLYTLSGTATSGLPITYSITGPAFIQENTLTVTGAGIITITAFQNGNENYFPANPVTTVFTVYKSNQTITGFPFLPDITFAGTALQINLDYVATSGLSILYSVITDPTTGVANINDNILHITGPGLVTVTGLQPGNENYISAMVQSSFIVKRDTIDTDVTSEKDKKSTIYPNPGNGIFIIKDLPESISVSLTIVSQLGQEIITQYVNSNSLIELSNLNAGMYYARISFKNKTTVEKLIISP